MSLLLWLPLNGNLNNCGIADYFTLDDSIYLTTYSNECITTDTGDKISIPGLTRTVYSNSGKIGKCVESEETIISQGILNTSILNNFTISFWYYPKSISPYNSLTNGIFSISNRADDILFLATETGENITTSEGNRINGSYQKLKGDLQLIYNSSSSLALKYGGEIIQTIPIERESWQHLSFTYNGTTLTFYKNGDKFLVSTPQNQIVLSDFVSFGSTGISGKYNDIRIYNNCLSSKEVKEISKAKVLHYPMNQIDGVIGGRNLILNSKDFKNTNNINTGWTNNSLFVRSTDNDGFTIMSLARTGATSLLWTRLVSSKILKSDVLYGIKVSFEFMIDDISALDHQCLCSTQVYNSSGTRIGQYEPVITNTVFKLNKPLASGQWIRAEGNFTLQKAFVTNNQSVDISDKIPIYLTISLNLVKNGSVHYKKVKVEDSAQSSAPASIWTPAPEDVSGMEDTTVYDASGLRNNGTYVKKGKPNWSNEKVSGQGSYNFAGSNYILCGRNAMMTDEITVSWWGYMENWGTYSRAISCTESGGWNFEPNTGKMAFPLYAAGSYRHVKSLKALDSLSPGWHMFTGTYNGLVSKIYIDGVLNNSVSIFSNKTPIQYNAYNGIFIGAEAGGNTTTPAGSYFNGNIQDVRIYATALSAEDVKELYQTRFSLSDNGTLFCGEYIENDSMIDYLNPSIASVSGWSGGISEAYNENAVKITATNGWRTFGWKIPDNMKGSTVKVDVDYKMLNKDDLLGFISFGGLDTVAWLGANSIQGSDIALNTWKHFTGNIATKYFCIMIRGTDNKNLSYSMLVKNLTFSKIDTVPSLTESGLVKTDNLYETNILRDIKIKQLNDGSSWARIFYHNNHSGTVLFSSNEEALECSTADKWSRLKYIEDYRAIDGKFEFLLEYPTDIPGESNRWKQTANPITTVENTALNSAPADGYEPISITWAAQQFGGLLKSTAGQTFIDGSTNTDGWFYAIGCKSSWSGGIPADSRACKNDVELWVRIDTLPKFQIYDNKIIANEIIEGGA